MAAIRALTFDLWDTIVVDDSDEPKRRRQNLRSKRDERRHLVWKALSRHGELPFASVELAYDVVDAAFRKVWHEHHITWPIGERLDVLLAGLGRVLPPTERATLVAEHEGMELAIRPDLIEGVGAALAELKRHYKLAIVSDAIVTPGRLLRELLASYDLARYFDGYFFSDEVGRSKPDRRMFDAASAALEVPLSEMVHIGDREHNDVGGPKAAGMRAVLFTAHRAAPVGGTQADAVCASYAELPAVLSKLAKA